MFFNTYKFNYKIQIKYGNKTNFINRSVHLNNSKKNLKT